ncbi:MAG TPA: SGNH hydrolase domain-containing protein, partial [Pseudoxanthomonas sp.]
EGGLTMPRSDLETYRAPVIAAMQELTRQLPGTTIWDPLPVLCPTAVCTVVHGNRPLFFDGDHLSGYGNRLLLPAFKQHIADVSGGIATTASPAGP